MYECLRSVSRCSGGFGSLRGLFSGGGETLLRLLLRLRLFRVVLSFALGETLAVKQTRNAIGRLCADAQPVLDALVV